MLLAAAQIMNCFLMDRIVLWSPITTNTFSSSFDFACQSVLSKQSVQESPEALSFNARGALKHGKISSTICDTFEMYRGVLLTCAMEYRTAPTAYHVLFSFDPTITSCFFSARSAIQVFHAECCKDNSVDAINDKTDSHSESTMQNHILEIAEDYFPTCIRC